MNGINLKGFAARSFMIGGLTAKWGIDGDRPPMPPALSAALVCWYNTEMQRLTNADLQQTSPKLIDLSGNGHHLHLYGYTGTPTNGINADGWLQSAAVGYGVSYGQPLLTDYTACGTRKWNTIVPAYGAFASKSAAGFVMERTVQSAQYANSFNASTPITFEPKEFTYQSSTSYNGTPITKGAAADADTLILGRLNTSSGTRFDGSYKSFVLFNRTLTTEELAYVKRWMA